MKLSFDYDHPESIATIGELYRVKRIHDYSPCNPFTEWDGYWPMLVDHGRRNGGVTVYGDSSIRNPLSFLTDGQILRHQVKLAEIIDAATWGYCAGKEGLADYKRDSRGNYNGSPAELVRDYLERIWLESDSDEFDKIADILSIAGIESLSTCSTGYSQGDYADILIVATPAAMKEFGWSRRKMKDTAAIQKDMAGQARLYGQWAWGDCYGYAVERATDWDSDGEVTDWEELESVWGFYGDDWKENGADDFIVHSIRVDHAERVKELPELIKAGLTRIRELVTGRKAVTGEAVTALQKEIRTQAAIVCDEWRELRLHYQWDGEIAA